MLEMVESSEEGISMKLLPKYAENIIVALIDKGEFFWYITDKEIWYLDYLKRIERFEKGGYPIDLNYIDEARKDLFVLDQDNIEIFKTRIKDFEVSTEALIHYTEKMKHEDVDWYYDLSPSLYINFDRKILYSAYREPAAYEYDIPSGWYGEYRDFLDEIPEEYRYWSAEEKHYFE